jgi:GT2 family glycosyltransferase
MADPVDVSVVSTAEMVSIVIPCGGMLEYTKLCVPSVLKHSRAPFELIFLDIGSLDGTAEYLAGLKAGLAGQVRMEVVRTETDLGVRAACKQALQQTLGEYVVLLNNDTVVTNGWLNQMIGLASMTPANGMVGPMSNMAAVPQLVETVPYRNFSSNGKSVASLTGAPVDVAAIERFALSFRNENHKKWLYTDRLGGFCLLIKREVLDKIGHTLDQWTDLSLFDTDILSSKVKQAGYHFGTRTFSSSKAVLSS